MADSELYFPFDVRYRLFDDIIFPPIPQILYRDNLSFFPISLYANVVILYLLSRYSTHQLNLESIVDNWWMICFG